MMNKDVLQPFVVPAALLGLAAVDGLLVYLFAHNEQVLRFVTLASILAFSGLMLMAMKRNFLPFLYLLPLLFLHWWAILSVAYIETGAYITEQNDFGQRTGAALRLIAYMSVFFSATLLTSTKTYARDVVDHEPSTGINTMFNWGLVFANLILVFGMVYFGAIPLFQSNRFEYFQETPALVKKVFLAHGMIAFVAGIIYGKGQNKLTMRLFLFYLLLIVLSGDKFSAIFWCILSFYAGQKIANFSSEGKVNVRQILVFFAVIFLMLIGIVAIGFYFMHELDDSITTAIVDRALGLQGHVWYGIDQLHGRGTLNHLPLNELFAETSTNAPRGIDYLMYEVADTSFAYAMLELGITFTMGYPAVLLVYFGDFSIVVCFFSGALLGCVVRTNIVASMKFRLLDSILLYGVYFVLIDAFIMGRFWKLVSFKMILFLLTLLLVGVGRKALIRWKNMKANQVIA